MAHKSQVGPEVEKWVREFAGEMGKMAGVESAEVFRVMRFEKNDDKQEK